MILKIFMKQLKYKKSFKIIEKFNVFKLNKKNKKYFNNIRRIKMKNNLEIIDTQSNNSKNGF